MDKFKEQLALVQKYNFWILSVVVLLASIVTWFMSTRGIKQQYEAFKTTIEGKTSTVKGISTDKHPNETTLKGMDELNAQRAEEVGVRWNELYTRQDGILKWPPGFDPEFYRGVEPLRPPELTVAGGLVEELSEPNRNFYRIRAIELLPRLAERIGAKWNAKSGSFGGPGGAMPGGPGEMPGFGGASGDDAGAGDPGGIGPGGIGPGGIGPGGGPGYPGAGAYGNAAELDDSLVGWSPANQSQLLQIHFGFTMSDDRIPTTLQVLYAQEDLWVLESLMDIIKKTNDKATHRHEAAIKFIDSVSIGRSAYGLAGKISSVGGRGGGADSGMPGGMGPMGPGGMAPGGVESDAGSGDPANMPGMDPAGGGTPSPGADAGGAAGVPGGAGMPGGMPGGMPSMPGTGGNMTDNRYVDSDYRPLAHARLVAAMKGTPTDPKDQLLAVAKRVPVRMSFRMDQRRLAVLLAECGNSPLPVEVKQVRINRKGGGGAPGMGGMGGMDGMPGMDDAGGAPGGPAGLTPGGAGGDAGDAGAATGSMFPGGMPGSGGFAGGGAAGGKARQVSSSSEDPNEIGVEIYGIVYLYNPVNRALLGLPTAPPTTPSIEPPTTPTSTTEPETPPVNTGAGTNADAPVSGLTAN